jgi:hypothetical protein
MQHWMINLVQFNFRLPGHAADQQRLHNHLLVDHPLGYMVTHLAL